MSAAIVGGFNFDDQLFLKQYHFQFLQQKRKSIPKLEISQVPSANSASSPSSSVSSDKKAEKSFPEFEHLLVTFFNVCYYLGIVPHHFSVVNRKSTGSTSASEECTREIKISASKLHTILVIVVHLCKLIRLMLRFNFLSYNLRNPLNHFRIARTILSTSLSLFFLWTLWMRHHVCLKLLRRLANIRCYPNVTSLRNRVLQYLIILLMIVLICGTCVDRAIEESNRRWASICHENHSSSHSAFCSESSSTYGFEAHLAKALYTVFTYFGRVTGQFPRMDLLVVALTLWQLCKSFGKWLKATQIHPGSGRASKKEPCVPDDSTGKVLECYEELKEVSGLVGKLIGEMVICEIVEDIVYFSLEVQLRLRDADWFSILIIAETFAMAFLAKFVAACAAEHIQQMNKWLSQDSVLSQLSPGKVITLQAQLATNPVGMKGGSLFTLTKGFLANVVTVWLTYFIILLQFEIEFD